MKAELMRNSRGQILLPALVIMAVLLSTFAGFVDYTMLDVRAQRTGLADAQALALAEAGIDKAIYELNQNGSYTGETNTALGVGTFTTSVSSIDANTRRINATGYVPNSVSPIATKTLKTSVGINTDVISFQFGVQADTGGVELENSASVRGNLYSNGPVEGENSNIVRGDAVSAGPSGRIEGVHATGTARAHTITGSTIDKDAYYRTIAGTTVGGTLYQDSADQPTSTLPISDAQVDEWKAAAAAGGVHTSPCPYTISSSITFGPKKIDCDLTITGGTITLAGPIWVSGNITIKNSPAITIQSSLGGASVAVVADKESDRINSSKITLENSTRVRGTGQPGSYVLFLSQNNSAQNGGGKIAIDVKNSANGDMLVYAGHGRIALQNSINLKEVTGWKIEAKNSAEIVYQTGLGSALFTSGPGGSWAYVPGSYVIMR